MICIFAIESYPIRKIRVTHRLIHICGKTRFHFCFNTLRNNKRLDLELLILDDIVRPICGWED